MQRLNRSNTNWPRALWWKGLKRELTTRRMIPIHSCENFLIGKLSWVCLDHKWRWVTFLEVVDEKKIIAKFLSVFRKWYKRVVWFQDSIQSRSDFEGSRRWSFRDHRPGLDNAGSRTILTILDLLQQQSETKELKIYIGEWNSWKTIILIRPFLCTFRIWRRVSGWKSLQSSWS